jgi:hypothetical protein
VGSHVLKRLAAVAYRRGYGIELVVIEEFHLGLHKSYGLEGVPFQAQKRTIAPSLNHTATGQQT